MLIVEFGTGFSSQLAAQFMFLSVSSSLFFFLFFLEHWKKNEEDILAPPHNGININV